MEGGLEADLGAALALGLEAGLELGAMKSVRSPNCLQEASVFRLQLYNFEAFPNLLENLGNLLKDLFILAASRTREQEQEAVGHARGASKLEHATFATMAHWHNYTEIDAINRSCRNPKSDFDRFGHLFGTSVWIQVKIWMLPNDE